MKSKKAIKHQYSHYLERSASEYVSVLDTEEDENIKINSNILQGIDSPRKNYQVKNSSSTVEEFNRFQSQHWKNNKNTYFLISLILLSSIFVYQITVTYLLSQDRKLEFAQNTQQLTIYNSNQAKIYGAPYHIDPIKSVSITPNIKNENPPIKQQKPVVQMNPASKSNVQAGKTPSENQIDKRIQASGSNLNTRAIAGITNEQKQFSRKLLTLKSILPNETNEIAEQQRIYYEQKYNISSYKELPFCIVIPSYNNAKDDRYKKNIYSVLGQDYHNYHIVFIDDASTDNTGKLVQEELEKFHFPKDRYIMITNTEQKRAMPNLRLAANEYCLPEDIYLIADGDDQLLGRQVLKFFNAVFQKDNAWFVYTNFLTIRGSVGYSRPFPDRVKQANSYRSYPFVTSHLRAFYTKLFRNIKEKDLKDDSGNYLKAANDVAICIPILQQSHEHVSYVPELSYYYNSNTGMNNHIVRLKEQKSNDRMLRKRQKYEPLEKLFD